MKTIPIFLTAEKHHILIVGSGTAAMAKVALFAGEGARLSVIGCGAEAALTEAGLLNDDARPVNVQDRPFAEDDLVGKTLVYVGVEDEITEERIVRLANARSIPVNVIDKPAKSNFITPAQFKRGPLSVAFSSGGVAPVFVRRLRATLERILPPSLGILAEAAGNTKGKVKALIPDGTARRQFWDRLFDNAAKYSALDLAGSEKQIISDARAEADGPAGFVQLVGSGPGDPDLLTIKAHRALQQADIILYDRLVSREVMALARRDAELIYVGKKEGNHGCGQDNIHKLLIREAKAGKRVVRLKGGDPMVFGRIAEEMAELRTNDIDFEIVPGITALTGIASRVQIPLTDRAYSSSITLVTAHLKDGGYREWANLAGEGRTLGIYMGVKSASDISDGLQRQGVQPSMPVAIIENGTRANERRFFTTLKGLPDTITANDVKSPALLLIGDVVKNAAEWPDHIQNEFLNEVKAKAANTPLSASA